MISTFSVSVTTFGAICSLREERLDGPAAVRAGFEQHEGLTDQVARDDLALLRERMRRRGHQEQFLAHDRDRDQVRIVDRQREQPEVGVAGAQLPNQARRRARRELDVDLRMFLAEGLEQGREHVEAHGHAADQADGAAHRALIVEDAGAGALEILEHALAEAEQRGAGGRDPDLAAEPEEQLLLQLLFEQQDLAADGGLREVQLLAGAGERSRLRDRAQYLELSQVHAFVTPSRRYSVVCAAGRQCPISKGHRADRTDL